MRATTSPHNTVISVLYPDDISRFPAIIHGRQNEARALAQLGEILREGRGDGALEVSACGLFVDCTTGYLAASPDGVIDHQVTDREEITH